MQWLIDIIDALFDSRHRYFDRGDSGFDLNSGDFVKDDAWHDLDLSAIIPANAEAANITVSMKAVAAGYYIYFRRKGYTQWGTFHQLKTQRPGSSIAYCITIAVDDDRFLQYRCQNVGFLNIDFAVRGWWMR